MSVEIYGMSLSAPCRICYLTCEVLGIEYKMVNCDLMKGENRAPEFLKVHSISKIFICTCFLNTNKYNLVHLI